MERPRAEVFMPGTPQHRDPLKSRFADDPEMSELIVFFVDELPSRVEAIRAAWRARQIETLTRLVHQLKGASAGYGFEPIGDAAGAIERQLRTPAGPGARPLQSGIDQLTDLCARACGAR
jgi:HPt (histidine-containing phosphotransfer) domain-containing protein